MHIIRRLIAIFLLLATLLVPSALSEEALRGYDEEDGYVYVTLGTFPQTRNGAREPIVWRVLQVQDGRAYLLSEYVLEARRVHDDSKEYANDITAGDPGFDGDFTQTELHGYLNGEFMLNLTDGEKALLVQDEEWGYFTLPSAEELKDASLGFAREKDRKAWGTEYAVGHNLLVYGSAYGYSSPYWIRNQSSSSRRSVRCVMAKGEWGYYSVTADNHGVRPACWLDMNRVVILSGSGTLENPYVLLTDGSAAASAAYTGKTAEMAEEPAVQPAADIGETAENPEEPAAQPAAEENGYKTITITFAGDVTLGGEDYLRNDPASFASVYAQNGPEYFLANFAEFFAEDDLTIVNLEGVLTDNDSLRPEDKGNGTESGSGYWFRGSTEYVQVLTAASVEAVSLANNHTLDYGPVGLRDTIATLDAAGVEWFGTRDKHRDETEKFFFYEKDGVTIAFIGLYWQDYQKGNPDGCGAWLSEQIRYLKESGQADAVVAVFHGGQEYGRHRTRPQTVFTAMAMKAGADLVICHHAHVVLGMDVIENRSAIYSLGNFCFGGNRNAYQLTPKKKTTVQDAAPALVVRAVLTFDDDGNYVGQQISLYPVQTTSVDRNGGNEQPNNYQPKFVTGPLAAHVLHLLQVDMYYDLQDEVNRELKKFVIAEENKLEAMDTSDGMVCITLPYLPAEGY